MGCGGSRAEAQAPGEADENEKKRQDKSGNFISQYDRNEKRPEDNQEMTKIFQVNSAGNIGQVQGLKPWLGRLKEPSSPLDFKNEVPSIAFDLDYVYGFRGFDSRQNLFYTSNSNKVVYVAAALGIVLEKSLNKQRFFGGGLLNECKGHSDDILALAIAADRDLVATGEIGNNPKILVWRASEPEGGPVVSFTLGKGRRGVSCLGFSHDSKYLASADLNSDHFVSVWDLNSGSRLAEFKTGPYKILDLAWSHDFYTFATAGIKHNFFWEVKNGLLENTKGLLGLAGQAASMTTVQWFSEGSTLTGAMNGQLYLWKEKYLQKTVQVHAEGQGVQALSIIEDKVFSGGKDNKIIELDSGLVRVKEYALNSCPRALDYCNGKLLVGTRDGKITEIGENGAKFVLMDSHNDGEVWGLAIAAEGVVVTAGDDNQVKSWNPIQRRCIASGSVEISKSYKRVLEQDGSTLAVTGLTQQARSVAVNSTNNHIAVGHNDGRVTIRSGPFNLNNIIAVLSDAEERIGVIQYSPSDTKLAVGSHDKSVYVYDAAVYKLINKFSGHSSFIISLDWSIDGSVLLSTSADFELLFWDLISGNMVEDGDSKHLNEHWAQWTCPFGWPVRGIFGAACEATHVNSVQRSPCGNLVAVGNDWGLVEVFGFPNREGAKSVAYRGHGEHVLNVKWSKNGDYLFSAGGCDKAIMQWKKR